MMKKICNYILSLIMAITVFATLTPIQAEPDYTDTTYWNNRCTGKTQMSAADKEACLGYSKYLQQQNNSLGQQLKDIEAKRAEVSANIEKYAQQISEYQVQIDAKQVEIDAKQAEIDQKQAEIDAKQAEINEIQNRIDEKQKEIDAKQAEIDATQAKIDALMEKISHRLETSQSTMRVNKYLEILAGASTFEDFLRIANGLNSISQFDKQTLEEMLELMALMEKQKQELEVAKQELKDIQEEMVAEKKVLEGIQAEMVVQKEALTAEQGNLLALQYEVQIIEDEYLAQKAELQAQYSAIAANIESKNAVMREIAAAGLLDAIPINGSNGWTVPVPNAVRSAGTWFYPGGGLHLGYDFAAPVGSTIYAPASGVVINSVNGCPTYGNLGNWCTGAGGAAGGGNQVYLLAVANGNLYGIMMAHMMLGSPIAEGTVVSPGTAVGQVGSSGNSTGPHCHVEVVYLGSASNFSSYAQTWNGDCAFGAGWGYQGYNLRCEAGNGAPCRVRPETLFGY